jgi:hypothetical protein
VSSTKYVLSILFLMVTYSCGGELYLCSEDVEDYSGGLCIFRSGDHHIPNYMISDLVDEFSDVFHVDMPRLLSRRNVSLEFVNSIKEQDAIGVYIVDDRQIKVMSFEDEWFMSSILIHELLHVMEDVFEVPSDEQIKHTNPVFFGKTTSLEQTIYFSFRGSYGYTTASPLVVQID